MTTMVQRSRQLLVEMYTRLVSDQAALKALASSQTSLRTFAQDLAALTSQPAEVLGETAEEQKTTGEWLEQVETMNGSLQVCVVRLTAGSGPEAHVVHVPERLAPDGRGLLAVRVAVRRRVDAPPARAARAPVVGALLLAHVAPVCWCEARPASGAV